ncbi:MAG: hypothetical protein WDN31_04360 [Hyphomicrobium sp.]
MMTTHKPSATPTAETVQLFMVGSVKVMTTPSMAPTSNAAGRISQGFAHAGAIRTEPAAIIEIGTVKNRWSAASGAKAMNAMN